MANLTFITDFSESRFRRKLNTDPIQHKFGSETRDSPDSELRCSFQFRKSANIRYGTILFFYDAPYKLLITIRPPFLWFQRPVWSDRPVALWAQPAAVLCWRPRPGCQPHHRWAAPPPGPPGRTRPPTPPAVGPAQAGYGHRGGTEAESPTNNKVSGKIFEFLTQDRSR